MHAILKKKEYQPKLVQIKSYKKVNVTISKKKYNGLRNKELAVIEKSGVFRKFILSLIAKHFVMI